MRRMLIASAALFAFPLLASAQVANAERPNVVLIITDDVGYGDFGSSGAPHVKTPKSTVWPEMAFGSRISTATAPRVPRRGLA